MTSQSKIIFGTMFFLVVVFGITNHLHALSPGLSPFGGKVVKVEWCRCSNNFMITYIRVKSSMPEYLTIRGTTKIYPYGGIKRGEEILGTTVSLDVCVTKRKCRKTYNTELIGIVGSSR